MMFRIGRPILVTALLLRGGNNPLGRTGSFMVLGARIGSFPNCEVRAPAWIGDGSCDGGDYNTAECGWDGGDCDALNAVLWEKYPECKQGIHPGKIGDGDCDHGMFGKGLSLYNSAECGWDGGDCVVDGYPDCHVASPGRVGDGQCDNDEYGAVECGWDGGDCIIDAYPDCHIEYDGFGDWREKIGDGVCDGYHYNTADCAWDGGDCDAENAVLWEKYPECNGGILPELIGDGYCDGNEMLGGDTNIAECGWEGGDCVVIGYPDCHVEHPNNIGDRDCVDRNDKYGYNTIECGWEGGDCIEHNKLNPPPGWTGNPGTVILPQENGVKPQVGGGGQEHLRGNGAHELSPLGIVLAVSISSILSALM